MTDQDPKIVNPTAVRHPARYRGVLNSADINDFQEKVVKDIHDNARGINSVSSRLESSLTTVHSEVAHLRRLVDLLLNQRDYVEKADAASFGIHRFLDFSDTRGIFFPGGLNDKFSAMVSAQFGEATLPTNAIENRFYTTSIRSGRIISAPDLVTRVTHIFDKGEGDGLVDYERGGRVTPGKPNWAFNGNNQRYWRRRVEFPLDSRVDQVEVELTVDVPSGASSEANLLEIFPFPNGSVDLISVSTAGDLANSFTTLPGFSSKENATYSRWHFPVQKVERVKVWLRQRNWVEENGKKVFYYGMQELGLKLVDYDKNYSTTAAFGDNHTFIAKFTAPDGFGFNDMFRVLPDPNFLLEDTGRRHVRLRLGTDETFSSFLWDSDSNVEPQSSGSNIDLGGASTLYAAFELQFVESIGGSLSPYPVGTTPYVKGLGVSYTLEEL
jgi:hypothetical protein|tara:strand:+ start:60 stop:1379 length:1320 start_codon:yes stop_codon:yes gene_type:complete